MSLREQDKYKTLYEWLIAKCQPDIVERLDGTLGDYEADTVLASFLDDVHPDGHIEISKSFTISKNPEINSFDELVEKTEWQIGYDSNNFTAPNLDIFDSETDATGRAEELDKRGETGITMTQLLNSAAVETWKLIGGQWQ